MATRPRDRLTREQRRELLRTLRTRDEPPRLRYCPFEPTPKQRVFLKTTCLEAFYGGAAGPGKSTALLMAALQYVDVPGYAALILRKTYADLALPGALMEVAHDWLGATDAKWKADTHTWEFPSGATLTFGYLEHEEEKRRYASAEFQFVGFDELTHFTETMYTFLISRVRRKSRAIQGVSPDGIGVHQVPIRIRGASNPGGRGHDWVYARFIDPETREPGVVFVPAKVTENPYLDVAQYVKGLEAMTGAERERLLHGDWLAMDAGTLFNTDLIVWTNESPKPVASVRYWDLAASEPGPQAPDPDWTVGVLMHRHANRTFTVEDVRRFRLSPAKTDLQIQAAAQRDGRRVPVVVEQEPGAGGKRAAMHVQQLLPGWYVKVVPSSGSKEERAVPCASALENGTLRFLNGVNWRPLVEELKRFPGGSHDDFVDALSGAYDRLTVAGPSVITAPTATLPTRSWARAGR